MKFSVPFRVSTIFIEKRCTYPFQCLWCSFHKTIQRKYTSSAFHIFTVHNLNSLVNNIASFDDVIKSREDLERYIQEAQAYANTIVPQSRGEAARIVEEATAYKEAIVSKAEGEAERFEALLVEYQKAPEVTRERLYLEAQESVFYN